MMTKHSVALLRDTFDLAHRVQGHVGSVAGCRVVDCDIAHRCCCGTSAFGMQQQARV
jgi:hypothetical protein